MTTTMSSETRSHRLTKHYSSRLYSNRSLTSRANEEMFSYSNQCISFRNTNSNDNNGNKQYCNRTWYSNQHFVFNFSLVDIISSDSSSSVFLSILSLIFVCISVCVCVCMCVTVIYSIKIFIEEIESFMDMDSHRILVRLDDDFENVLYKQR